MSRASVKIEEQRDIDHCKKLSGRFCKKILMKRLLLLFDLFGLVGFFGAKVSVREVVYVCICGALWFSYFF